MNITFGQRIHLSNQLPNYYDGNKAYRERVTPKQLYSDYLGLESIKPNPEVDELIKSENPESRIIGAKKAINASNLDDLLRVFLMLRQENNLDVTGIIIDELSKNKKHQGACIKVLRKTKDHNVKESLAAVLSKFGNNSHINLITPLLKSNSRVVQGAALAAMAKLGTTENFEDIKPFLDKRNYDHIRRSAIECMSKLANIDKQYFFLDRIEDTEEEEYIRIVSLKTLAKISNSSIIEDIEPFLDSSESKNIRIATAKTIEKLTDNKNSVGLFARMLKDDEKYVRLAGIDGLKKFGNFEHLGLLNQALNKAESEDEMYEITQTISKLKEKALISQKQKVVSEKYNHLQELKGKEKVEYLVNLAKSDDKECLSIIKKCLKESKDGFSQEGALKALQELAKNSEKSFNKEVSLVDPLLKSPSIAVKKESIKTLGIIGNESCIPKLLPFLNKNEEITTRTTAAIAISNAGSSKYLSTFKEMLKEENQYIIMAGLKGIERFGDSSCIEDVAPLLKSDNEKIHKLVLAIIADHGNKEHAELAVEFTTSPHPHVRNKAAKVLGNHGGVTHIKSVAPLIEDTDEKVSEKAKEATQKILDRIKESNPILSDQGLISFTAS